MLPIWLTDTVTPDLSRAIHYTLLWGLEGVVLRTVGGQGERVPFVNEAQLRTRLADADLPVIAVDPGLFEGSASERAAWMNDVMALEEVTAFCDRIRCTLIVVGALAEDEDERAVEALRSAGAVAAKRGQRVAVRNEGLRASGEAMARFLAAVNHPGVGVQWSPASALEAGHDPAAGLEALLRIQAPIDLIAVRDGETVGGTWQDRTPGFGAVGWHDHLLALAEAGYEGPLSLEVRGASKARAGLDQATAMIALIRAARRARRNAVSS